jgi:hypothetical protein
VQGDKWEILPFASGNCQLESLGSLLRLMRLSTGAVFLRGVCGGGDGILADGLPFSLAQAFRTPTQWAFSGMLRTIYIHNTFPRT